MQAKLQPNGDILLHYGVKGMRWGVRKSRTQRAADRRKRQITKAKKKHERLKAKEKKQLTKVGIINYYIKRRIKLRTNATKELDSKLRYLQKNKGKNRDAIKDAKQTKEYYNNLNDLAYDRIRRNQRNKKIVGTIAAVGGTAMSVPAVRKDIQKSAGKAYYKLKDKAMKGSR